MPWRCPSCRLPIRHNEAEERPRQGERYRCHVCRLELIFDPEQNRLVLGSTVAPDEGDEPEDPTAA